MPDRGRRVLVVGATGRLGVAISRALADRGDIPVLTARDPARLEALAASLALPSPGVSEPSPQTSGPRSGHPSPRVSYVCADLTAPDAVDTIMRGLKTAVPRIDDVVLACGPFPRTPFDTLKRDDLLHALTVHAVAPLLLAHALADNLREGQGAVVALSDAGVTRPFTNHVAYLTAKGALQTGLRALAVELAPDVRVNIIALGIVADPEADADPLRIHRLATRSPLGRFGTSEEVVHATLALLDATWATGEIWGIGR